MEIQTLVAEIRRTVHLLQHEFPIDRSDRVAYLGLDHLDFVALLFARVLLGFLTEPLDITSECSSDC